MTKIGISVVYARTLQESNCPKYCYSCVPHSLFDCFQAGIQGEVEALTKVMGQMKIGLDMVRPWGIIKGKMGYITHGGHTSLTYCFEEYPSHVIKKGWLLMLVHD